MTRGEHHPDGREHRIEFAGAKREGFCVGFPPAELQSGCRSTRLGAAQQLGRQVAGSDVGTCHGCRDRYVARARGHVKHAIAAANTAGGD